MGRYKKVKDQTDAEFYREVIERYNRIRKHLCEITPKNIEIINRFLNRKRDPE